MGGGGSQRGWRGGLGVSSKAGTWSEREPQSGGQAMQEMQLREKTVAREAAAGPPRKRKASLLKSRVCGL